MVVRSPHWWTPDPFERMWRWEHTSKGYVLHLERPAHYIGSWHTVYQGNVPVLATLLEAAHNVGAVVCVSCAIVAFAYQEMAWTG